MNNRTLIIKIGVLLSTFSLVICSCFPGNEGFISDISSDLTITPQNSLEPTINSETTYLADLTPIAVQVGAFTLGVGSLPFTDGSLPEGGFLKLGETLYQKALFAHAPSLLAFSLNKKYTTFQTNFFVHPDVSCGDGVQFVVYLDNQSAFISPPFFSGQGGSVTLDVSGVQTIFLQARSNKTIDCDWAVWGDPTVNSGVSVKSIDTVSIIGEPLIAIQVDAPCSESNENENFIYFDCNDVRRIRKEIETGNPDAILNYLALSEYLQQFSFDFEVDTPPSLNNFMPYLFGAGHDYPPRQLALLWLVTGDKNYANKVKLLLKRAIELPISTDSKDSSFGLIIPIEQGGEIYQSLLFAYASIRESGLLTTEEQEYYEDYFIRHAQVMLRWSDDTHNPWNPGIRSDATAAIIALYLHNDPRAATIYTSAIQSLYARIEAWFDDNGGYLEYSDNYTPYVLESILLYSETEYRLGNNLYIKDFSGKDIHEMCRWFLTELTPQGTLVGMNDGGWTSIDPGLMQLCSHRYSDPDLTFAYKLLQLGQTRLFSAQAYFHQFAWVGTTVPPKTPFITSSFLPASGLAVFRSGWTENDQFLLMQFTPSVHHQHFHSGSIVIYDQLPWLIDNGYPASSDEEYIRGSSSVDHSTITLDDKNHDYTGGELTFFQTLGDSGYMNVNLHTYAESNFSRSVFWIKPYHQWIVFDQVNSQEKHNLAVRWYVVGDSRQLSQLSWEFLQDQSSFQVFVFPSIEMTEKSIERKYLWGSNPAYGSSKGMAAFADVENWPVQIASVLSSQPITKSDSIELEDGRLIITVLNDGNVSQVWLPFVGNPGVAVDSENYLIGLTGCTLWNDNLLKGYSLYSGTSLVTKGEIIVTASSPVSIDVNLIGRTITLGETGVETLAVYWPEEVKNLYQEDGRQVAFTWKDQVLEISNLEGNQVLNVNEP